MASPLDARMTFLFIHGAWHHAALMKPVADALRGHGPPHHVHTPTLAGHEPGNTDVITLADMVDGIVDYVTTNNLTDLTVVAHSSGGIIATQAVPQIRDRVRRVVFHSAFIVPDGLTGYEAVTPTFKILFDQLKDPVTQRIPLPEFLWRDFMADAIATHAHTAWTKLVPEPAATYETALDQGPWLSAIGAEVNPLPTSYLHSTGDILLPLGAPETADGRFGYNWVPKYPAELGTHAPRMVPMDRCHEVYLTDPAYAARRIIVAARD